MNTLFKIAAAALFTVISAGAAGAQISDRPSSSAPRVVPVPVQPGAAPQTYSIGPPAPSFQEPQLATAVTSAPLSILSGGDRREAKRRLYYVLGFSLAADKQCDFLTEPTTRQLVKMAAPIINEDGDEGVRSALVAGLRDGATFVRQNQCGSMPGRQLARSLTALWESV